MLTPRVRTTSSKLTCSTTVSPRQLRRWIVRGLALVVLVIVPAAQALEIIHLNPRINCRFSSGNYAEGNLKENPRFMLAGHDLSGLGWSNGSNFGVTLISPQHCLTASHVTPLTGQFVWFLNRDGVMKRYTVESVYFVEHTPGVRTELALCRLTAPIPPEDHIGFLPTLRFPMNHGYTGLKVLMYGQGQICGNATIAHWGVFDLLPFNAHDHVADDTMFIMEWGRSDGDAQANGGDSGSPTLVVYQGKLAVIGIHSAVDVSKPPYLTADVLVPAYFDQINARLAADGFALGNAFTEADARKPAPKR